MEKLLALTINGTPIEAPSGIPSEGLSGSGGKVLSLGLALLLIAAALLALGFLLWGGLNWVMSGGDKEKVTSARRTIIYAILGLLLCFIAFAIISFFGQMFNVKLLNITL